LTATVPPGRFGALDLRGNKVATFMEKPKGDGALINGGFFVLSPSVIDLVADDQTIWEREPLERLSRRLVNWRHFSTTVSGNRWTRLRDKMHLEELWQSGKAPWKVWA
jgi:glucose-1-phosphate cytidylyltransferase